MQQRIFMNINMVINICLISLNLKIHKHPFIGIGDIGVFVDARFGADKKTIPQNGCLQKLTFFGELMAQNFFLWRSHYVVKICLRGF